MVESFVEDLDKQYSKKDVFCIVEVSRIFGVKSKQTIYNWAREGRFPNAFRTSKQGGGLRITRRDLIEFYRKYRIQR